MASAAELYLSRSRGIPPKPMINIERNIYSFFSKEDADPQACWEERKRQVRDICSIQASRPAYLNMTHCKMREPSNSCPYIYIVPCHNIKPEGGGGQSEESRITPGRHQSLDLYINVRSVYTSKLSTLSFHVSPHKIFNLKFVIFSSSIFILNISCSAF